MALEDFFTLTEMKDGLSSLNRVEELVDVMQKQKDCVSSIMGDAARQWLTVASTLIATENKDCLNHFVHLNGLCFLNQLLQEAKKCSKDVSAHVEEFICILLSTLERLPVNKDRLTAAAIGVTVEQLLSHESLLIKDRARILLSKWNNALTDDASHQDLEKGDRCPCPSGQPKTSTDSNTIEKGACSDTALGISPCGSLEVHSAGIECQQNVMRCTENSTAGPYDDEKTSITSQMNSTTSSNSVGVVKEMQTLGSNFAPLSHPEKLAVTEESSIFPATGLASAGTCSSLIGKERDDELNDVSVSKDVPGDVEEMEVDAKENSHSQKETCNASSNSSLSASIPVTATELVPCNIDSKGGESCISNTTEHENNTGVIDEVQAYLKESKSQHRSGNILETCFQKNEARSDSDMNDFGCDASLDGVEFVLPTNSSRAQTRSTDEIAERSTLELEYEDALEVARQVAVEVEREVVDYREPFCSSPEANSGETTAADTPDLLHDKEGQQLLGDEYKSATGKDDSDSSSFPIDDVSPESIYTNPDKSEVVMEPAEVTSATQEEDGQLDRNRCVIDLNEDISAEDLDFSASPVPYVPVSVLTPIAVIATPRESQGLPGTPLHFEGELGWKGSAATSAFQPASSRRTPDAEKISSPKQIPNFLGFDLNVAENEEGVALDQHPTKQILLSSRLPSCDSSIEVSSKRAERLKLDLNRLSDEDPSICPSSNLRFPYQGGDQSLSSASSSCSKQPYTRDFDLNDNPSFFDADNTKYLDKSSSKTSCGYESPKLINPVITIMGSRMAVERKDYTEQSRQSLMGTGSNIEPMMPARTMYPYHHMIPLPYGPPIPIPPPLYEHRDIPYHMIDPRGFTVTPQVMASSPAQSSFLMSLSGAPSGFSGVGSSRTGLDLNSGTISLEVGSREEQMFMQGPGDLMQGQQRASSFASNSSMSLKRKELELGLESYPNGFKKVASWH